AQRDVAVAEPREQEDVVARRERGRLDRAGDELGAQAPLGQAALGQREALRDGLEPGYVVAEVHQGQQVAPAAAADDEDPVGRLEKRQAEVLLPREEPAGDVELGLAHAEVAPVALGVAPQRLERERAGRRVRGDRRRPRERQRDGEQRRGEQAPHAQQPTAAPSARGSEPPLRPSASRRMSCACPITSLQPSTTWTSWPRARSVSATPAPRRSSRRSARVASPHVRPRSQRGASTAACGARPRSTTRVTSAACVCGWPSPPIVPYARRGRPSTRYIEGISVCAVRLPGARQLGWAGSSEKNAPRFCRSTPVSPAITPLPNSWYVLWMTTAALPSPSAVTIAMVSPSAVCPASSGRARRRAMSARRRASRAGSSARATGTSTKSGSASQRSRSSKASFVASTVRCT